VPVQVPHPGAAAYVEAFARAFTPRTRVLAITHVTNSIGDMLPVAELCRAARERDVLSMVDGAQTFGALDVDLVALGADFYSGSAHKWPCGPKETGVLYVSARVQDRIHASLVSLYPGAVGISRKLEAFGQRDEAALASVGAAFEFQDRIGRGTIETRVRQLVRRLADGLQEIQGVRLWTRTDANMSAGILVFKPAALEPRRVATMLYERHRIACAAAGGATRPGVRFSPHFYNTIDEMDRTVHAVRSVLADGA
jgi:selenocysteine lyase/cysteine desulfurase